MEFDLLNLVGKRHQNVTSYQPLHILACSLAQLSAQLTTVAQEVTTSCSAAQIVNQLVVLMPRPAAAYSLF